MQQKKSFFGKVYELESVSTTHGANRGAKTIFFFAWIRRSDGLHAGKKG
jgi:hypothetical protein